MESFQGYYRDRTDGGWECRYFSIAYPCIRVLFFIIGYVGDFNVLTLCSGVCIITAALVLIVRPYKEQYRKYNTLDALMMLSLALTALFILEYLLYIDGKKPVKSTDFAMIASALSLIPLLYMVVGATVYIFKTSRVLVTQNLCV